MLRFLNFPFWDMLKIVLKDIHILKPVNITIYGKREFADMTKLRILLWEDYLGSSGWAVNIITKFIKRRNI